MPDIFRFQNVKIIHFEPTTNCNAACPQCLRTRTEFEPNELSLDDVKTLFTPDVLLQLEKIYMCGNYGDPASARQTIEMYEYFKYVNPNIIIGMNTNGGIRYPEWWARLAKVMDGEKDYVVFSIDGLEDTNHMYRKNVAWNLVMSNVTAFIEAGGSAHWDMLVYKHNEHQVDACEQLAREMGFTWFRAKVSKRPFTNRIEMPVHWQQAEYESGSIACHALEEQSIYIDAQGRVSPCCWLGARQSEFITDFAEVVSSWSTSTPNPVCASTCTKNQNQTAFTGQWQRNKALC